ncbi:hypothetical protein [Rhodoferax sp. GW822-FHT02A01]|uniref:hypothetical protein n=1 Tax=Rhodoferax sp. GW822-FHT02A01 TaxID=3141537 RepID=UPI00315D6081
MKATHHNTSRARSGPALSLPKKVRQSAAVIEIDVGKNRIMDARFLCVAINYPYMFENSLATMNIDRRWAPAFTLTCMEIDAALGNSTHGFRWRLLADDDGFPLWAYTLAAEYNQKVAITWTPNGPDVEILNPANDPHDRLRETIGTIIGRGVERAIAATGGAEQGETANGGAANDSVFSYPGDCK